MTLSCLYLRRKQKKNDTENELRSQHIVVCAEFSSFERILSVRHSVLSSLSWHRDACTSNEPNRKTYAEWYKKNATFTTG